MSAAGFSFCTPLYAIGTVHIVDVELAVYIGSAIGTLHRLYRSGRTSTALRFKFAPWPEHCLLLLAPMNF
jgi:hypothetical protein